MLKKNEKPTEYLERKYSERGLKFDGCFWKSCPTQAFGVIDGLPFYFRFRHDTATIELGEAYEYPDMFGSMLPHYLKYVAIKENVTGEPHAGELTPEGEVETFSYLIENLEEYIESEIDKDYRLQCEKVMREDALNKIENSLNGSHDDWELELLGFTDTKTKQRE